MASGSGPSVLVATWLERGRGLKDDPLVRSATSLMMTTAVTSLLGLVFWLVAARNYSSESVGRASAQISAVSLVGSLAALNITPVLVRFLPAAGVRSGWLIMRSYAVTVGLALIAATVFVLSGLGS